MNFLTFYKKNFILYAFIFTLGLFVFSNDVKAYTEVIDIAQGLDNLPVTGISAQTFIPQQSNFSKANFKVFNSNTCGTVAFYLCEGSITSTSTLSTTYNCGGGNTFIASSTVSIPFQSTTIATFQPTNPVSIIPGISYYISLSCPTGSNSDLITRSQNTNPYSNGRIWNTGSNNNANNDAYFYTYYATDYIPLQFQIPNINNYIIKDFLSWQVYYDLSTSTPLHLEVDYGNTPGSSSYIDSDTAFGTGAVSILLSKSKTFNNGGWYARARLLGYYGSSWVNIATSSELYFIIDNTYGNAPDVGAIGFTPSYATSTLYNASCSILDNNTIVGSIECGFKRVINWAVYPSNSILNFTLTEYNGLQTKFPFNVYYDLTNSFKNAMASTTMSQDDTLGIPFIRNTGTTTEFYILPVISSSSVVATLGQSNTDTFRNTLGYVMWGLCGLYIFIRLTNK